MDDVVGCSTFWVVFESKLAYAIIDSYSGVRPLIKKESNDFHNASRDFVIENFYSGVARFKFKDLCDKNLGAEDYINIANSCNHIFIEEIPKFNDGLSIPIKISIFLSIR